MAMVGVASGSLQAACGQPVGGLTAGVVWPGLRVGAKSYVHLRPLAVHLSVSAINVAFTFFEDVNQLTLVS